MNRPYFLREAPTLTLADVREQVSEGVNPDSDDIDLRSVRIDLVDNHEIDLGVATVPATLEGVAAIGDALEVPTKFLERCSPDLQQHILTALLPSAGNVSVSYTSEGLQEVRNVGQVVIRPAQVVDVAMRVLSPEASVREFWATREEFRLDTMVTPESDRGGFGGDPQVGDITFGGIRVYQNRKRNLAPQVSQYMYRLACTNGMQVMHDDYKIDTRGDTVEEVLASLEEVADRAFRQVEDSIRAFYDMRSVVSDNPDRDLRRFATERRLPDRTITHLLERLSTNFDQGEQITNFDLVNLITNQANAPGVKDGTRRQLEGAGGHLIDDHSDRCSHCRSVLLN